MEGAPRVHSGAEDLLLSPRAEGGSKATGKGSFKDTLGRGEVLMGRERATFWDRILTGLASVAWPRCSGTEDQGVPGCHGTDWRTLDLSGQLGDRKIPELKSPAPKGRSLGVGEGRIGSGLWKSRVCGLGRRGQPREIRQTRAPGKAWKEMELLSVQDKAS